MYQTEKHQRRKAQQTNIRARFVASGVLFAGILLLVGLLFSNTYYESSSSQPGQLALRFLISDFGRFALVVWDVFFALLEISITMIFGPVLRFLNYTTDPFDKLFSAWQSVQCSQFLCYMVGLPSSGGPMLPYSCAPNFDPDQQSGYSPLYYRIGLAVVMVLLYFASSVVEGTHKKELRQVVRKSETRADHSRAYWKQQLAKTKTECEQLVAESNERLRLAQGAQDEKDT